RLANTRVADVFHHADDLCIWFHVGSGSHTDVRAERISSSEISICEGFVDNDDTAPALIHRERIMFVEVSSIDNPGAQGREEPRSDGVQVDIAIGGEPF